MTYDEAVRHAEQLDAISWDLAVFDEADFLFKPENKTVIALKKAVGNADHFEHYGYLRINPFY